VAGRIRPVPFEFVVRNFDHRSDIDVRPTARFVGPVIGDCHVGLAVFDVDFIRPVGVRFAATSRIWNVGLHQGLVPFADFGIDCIPLS
jgi:hypothetical protein